MSHLHLILQAAEFSSLKDAAVQVLTSTNPYSRYNKEGHITASGLMIKDEKVLLIFHPHIQQWLQPGGHIDEGETPMDAAIREVFEETGVVCDPYANDDEPLDIDIHQIPSNPQKGEGDHVHIDLLFLLRAVEERESSENIQKAWISCCDISNLRIQRALKKLNNETLSP
ncbi:NUDIX hydrolase [Polynucleobacter antarcticus]|uniref:NUDIX hydrolase n=1 Tax=Polynucleobacter antarcticus TaxID=1743162 RepID=A0A6M9PVG9_9BURK|nr:NUDIX domain-containing protein [Polynucleobacter antarcticus]QKM62927.1 NUDIX hydrolase [Polynucleobacter antarcticus]